MRMEQIVIRRWNNEEIYKRYMILSLHGQTKDALQKSGLGSWEYDILEPAYKCNMTDLMAAIGLAQLDRYNEILVYRKELIELYDNELSGIDNLISLKHYDNYNKSSGHLYIIRLVDKDIEYRNKLINELGERGIAANVHYKPLPLLTAYKKLGLDIKDYPKAYNMYKNEITLPLNSILTKEEVKYICNNLKELLD